jgi:hypothetical protein
MARKPNPTKPLPNARPRITEALRELFAGVPVSELADRLKINQSVVHRDWSGERPVSDARLASYLDALPGWSQKSRLLSAWIADALPEHLRGLVDIRRPSGKAAVNDDQSTAENLDIAALPIASREALRTLARIAEQDRDLRDWLAVTAQILAPMATPDKSRKKGKTYRY